MSKHSDRAKKGTRTQINAQIRFIQTNLTIKKKELSKAMQYKKYKLPGFDTQIARIKQGITKAEKDLKMFQRRKEKLADEGLI
jgi:D-mannonate dehydratase